MNKNTFLEELRIALSSELSAQKVKENIDYYDQYITGEVVKGRSEASVLAELGSADLIAKTIIQAKEFVNHKETIFEEQDGVFGESEEHHNSGRKKESMLHKILVIVFIVGIIFLVVSFIGGLISLIAPILVPVLLIVFVWNMLKRRM